MGVTSLILGIVAIAIAFFMPYLSPIAYLCGLIGLVLGVVDYMPILKNSESKGIGAYTKSIINTALGKTSKEKQLSCIGIVLCAVSFPVAYFAHQMYIDRIDRAFSDWLD